MSNKYKCSVWNCQSENNKLFQCPKSRSQSKKWKDILGVSEKEFYVCELHFDASFISYEKVLNDEAVPTIFMNDKLLVNQYCACCSSPISEGHQIGQLHLQIYGMLFSSLELKGEFMCSKCNDKMIEISDFIKIVEDNRGHFESMNSEVNEPIIKIEPLEYDIVEQEDDTKPFLQDSIIPKTEYNSDSEQDEEYESESSKVPKQKSKSKRVNMRIRKCDVCNHTSSTRDDFIDHIRAVHGTDYTTTELDYDLQLEIDDPHAFVGTKQSKECDICREVFTDRQLLIEHFKAHFDKDRFYVCPYCSKNCKGIVMLSYHKNHDHKIDKYSCICHRTYNREVEMKRCKKIHQNTIVDTKYVCDDCDSYSAFGDCLRLAHHKTKVHGNGTTYWCKVCLKPYSNEEFKECMKRHRDEIAAINIKCPDCDKAMPYSRFKGHYQNRHYTQMSEICEICGREFASKALLSGHQRSKHRTVDVLVNFNCDFCGKSFNSKTYLQIHMSKHQHHDTFQCTICLKRDVIKLEAHMKKFHPNNYDCGVRVNSETNLYHCPNCVQNFTSIKFYERHVARNTCSYIGECEVDLTKKVGSRTEGKFPCKLCKTVLKSILRLKAHMNQMHSGEMQCPMCNKISKNKKQLGKHLRSQHQMSIRDLRN